MGSYRSLGPLPLTNSDPFLCAWAAHTKAVKDQHGILCIITGIAGLFLHLKGIFEFELEMYKNLSIFSLLWGSLRGALPALAPSSMIYIGLLGFVTALIQPPVSK